MNRVKYIHPRNGKREVVKTMQGNDDALTQRSQMKKVKIPSVRGIQYVLPANAPMRHPTVAEADKAMHKKGFVRVSSLTKSQRSALRSTSNG
jgi:hypothetical protein